MKTNKSAGWISGMRVALACVALVALIGIDVEISACLTDLNQPLPPQALPIPGWTPNTGISEFIATAFH